jgi:RimJ/RimL family protein N-acetyltransferase
MRLELLAERHVPDVEAMLADPEILRHTRVPEPPPPNFAREWLDRYEARREAGTAEVWAVLGDDGTFLGLGMAPEIDRDANEVELGYIVVAEARRRGVATAILKQLTRWAFDEAGALRITLLIDADNPASLKVAERAGYVREGVMRSLHLKQERRGDTVLFSLLPSDPKPTG